MRKYFFFLLFGYLVLLLKESLIFFRDFPWVDKLNQHIFFLIRGNLLLSIFDDHFLSICMLSNYPFEFQLWTTRYSRKFVNFWLFRIKFGRIILQFCVSDICRNIQIIWIVKFPFLCVDGRQHILQYAIICRFHSLKFFSYSFGMQIIWKSFCPFAVSISMDI